MNLKVKPSNSNWTPSKGLGSLFAIPLVFLMTGCGTFGNLRVDPRPAPLRELPPAPIAVIRVPVVLTLPIGRLTDQPSFSLNPLDVQTSFPKWVDFAKNQAIKAWKD